MLLGVVIDTLVHVCVFLLVILLVLSLRKTAVHHRPTRRTNIPRGVSEECVWLQRLMDGVFDAVTCSGLAQAHINRAQEHVKALLEDCGIASRAEFAVRSLGSRPPVIVAIRASTHIPSSSGSGGPSVGSSSSGVVPGSAGNSNSPPLGPLPAGSLPSSSVLLSSAPLAGGSSGTGGSAAPSIGSVLEMEVDMVYEGKPSFVLDADFPVIRGRQLPLLVALSDLTFRFHGKIVMRVVEEPQGVTGDDSVTSGAGGALNSGANANGSPASGGDRSEDIAARTRGAPMTVAASPTRPLVEVTIMAVSEPDFSFQLETTFTRYRVRNFFGFAVAAKHLILRSVRKRLMGGAFQDGGVRFSMRLPPQLSRFEYPWCNASPDSGTSAYPSKFPTRGAAARKGRRDDDSASDISSFVHSAAALPRSASR